MNPIAALTAALAAGFVTEAEIEELIARGRARRKQSTLEKVAKKLDEGMTEEAILTALEQKQ